jgi:alginate O-acetyltransferase complex protein AlgI
VIFVLDAYAGRVHKQVRLLDYALYVVFFPQLVVGPITRYDELCHR